MYKIMFLKSSEQKAQMFSKRSHILYLEKCKVLQKDGRVVYLTQDKKIENYWGIPVGNTSVILLGIGTSISNAAVRTLSGAGTILGFCGSNGTPLHSAFEIDWFTPQNEYRPTKYVQQWLSFWYDDMKRLEMAKELQSARCSFLEKIWGKDRELHDEGFTSESLDVQNAIRDFRLHIKNETSIQNLLTAEGIYIKKLYRYAAQRVGTDGFRRDPEDTSSINRLLNHGNYLAYGLASSAIWALGIPFAFALMHGKTRRGALVFDIADLIKDTLVLPTAFICGRLGASDREFRNACIATFIRHQASDFMFEQIKGIAQKGASL